MEGLNEEEQAIIEVVRGFVDREVKPVAQELDHRDAPLMVVGEGTNEIQRNVIARQLVDRNTLAP